MRKKAAESGEFERLPVRGGMLAFVKKQAILTNSAPPACMLSETLKAVTNTKA